MGLTDKHLAYGDDIPQTQAEKDYYWALKDLKEKQQVSKKDTDITRGKQMTFEEAKKIFLNRGYIEVPGGTYYDADKWREAITVISKWLEQEPCEDINCISRQAVLDTLDKMDKALDDDRSVESYKALLTECYKDLPPVTLKEKTKWIPVSTNELPKLHEEVIVTDIETSDTYISRYIGNGYWECDNGLYQNRIIAWQSKPKPYKVESEASEWVKQTEKSVVIADIM